MNRAYVQEEADRLIGEGKVTVDGKKAERGMQILPDQKVCVDGKPVKPETKMVVLAVNKPVGIVCTEEKRTKQYHPFPGLSDAHHICGKT